MIIEPRPTRRFVLDASRLCNIKCIMCYHLHSYDDWKNHTLSLDECKQIVDDGVARGNNYMDITGGEPTIHPNICEIIEYALSKNIRTCIITNGIVSIEKTKKLINSGIDEFLVSRHGLRDTHNSITNHNNAYEKQLEFLEYLNVNSIRFNCVINKFNQTSLLEVAQEMSIYKPTIVNFINMNPHADWIDKSLETQQVIADLGMVEPVLNKAVEYLEDNHIGVNVRYYPMCRIAKKYRRCICNDRAVMFDPYEWDYATMPKTFHRYKDWGVDTSNAIEEQGKPCSDCKLHNICGGVNKAFYLASKLTYGDILLPLKGESNRFYDIFYKYRQYNYMTLKPR